MSVVLVVMNEQHSFFPDQEKALNNKFGVGSWERLNVPASGWTANQQREELQKAGNATLVFARPLPLMLRDASKRQGAETYVFHNDGREKKELPNGRIINTVAKTGWVIL